MPRSQRLNCLPAISAIVLLLTCSASYGAGDKNLESGMALFKNKDYAGAYAEWQKAAESGNAEAMFRLAGLYKHGLGLKPDDAKAYTWLRKAADLGYPMAVHKIGLFFYWGSGVEQDYSKAMKWL